ncbi:hypothetical protein [Candidatus Nitronereus thalassa]|uniref:Uncharacterized protein n=1 Tax=Candidatus Nitronereus thalassa TaxID=3020898 RepID=A0ABU3K961_9BACT|nr:hypothetical protein [Candidatus Nitronereus thalassa]MDT7042950.1 hypothetical protein [Candidatus Nitronereus thalassa]
MDELSLIIGVIVGALTIFVYLKGFLGWIAEKARNIFKPSDAIHNIPRKTLVLLPKSNPNTTWWHMGASGGEPAMQIVGHFTVTNISKFNVLPTLVKMKKPKILGHVMCRKMNENIYGSFMIPGGGTTDLSYDFWIFPPVQEKNEPFKADIAIVDQFGNEHWIKGVDFPYH